MSGFGGFHAVASRGKNCGRRCRPRREAQLQVEDRVVLLTGPEARLHILKEDGTPRFGDSAWSRMLAEGHIPGARRISNRFYVEREAFLDWARGAA